MNALQFDATDPSEDGTALTIDLGNSRNLKALGQALARRGAELAGLVRGTDVDVVCFRIPNPGEEESEQIAIRYRGPRPQLDSVLKHWSSETRLQQIPEELR